MAYTNQTKFCSYDLTIHQDLTIGHALCRKLNLSKIFMNWRLKWKIASGHRKSYLFVFFMKSRLHCYTSNKLWHYKWCAMSIQVASMTCLVAGCVPCSLSVDWLVWACVIPTCCIRLWINVLGHSHALHSTCHHWRLTVFGTIGNGGEWWELERMATTLCILHCIVDKNKTNLMCPWWTVRATLNHRYSVVTILFLLYSMGYIISNKFILNQSHSIHIFWS